MNTKEKIMASALAASLACAAAVSVFADGYTPQSDPLVTVSYVQAVKQEIKDELGIDGINGRISELSSSIIALEQAQARQAQDIQQLKNTSSSLSPKKNGSNKTETPAKESAENEEGTEASGEQTQTASEPQPAAPAPARAEYEVVHLIAGQTLTADSSLELIPRSGDLCAVITSETNRAAGVGISDLTDGKEVLDGEALESNHYMLVPRADGRGVTAVSGEAYLMVRGEYTIVG